MQVQVGIEFYCIFVDLDGQFMGWGEDQGVGIFWFVVGQCWMGQQVVYDSDQEGQGFVGIGLGLVGNIIIGQCDWQGQCLDWGVVGEFGFFKVGLQGWVQFEGGEG